MRTELFSKGELNAKAEIALMGRAVNITDKDNLAYVIDYICKVVKHLVLKYSNLQHSTVTKK